MEQLKSIVEAIENEAMHYDEQQLVDCCDYNERINTLLKLRKKLLDQYVMNNMDKYIDQICEFDQRLTNAFRADFENIMQMRNETAKVQGNNKHFESALFLNKEDDEQPFWQFLNHFSYDDSYCQLGVGYAKSVRIEQKKCTNNTLQPFENSARAYKERRKRFQNRALSSSFFYLYEETSFALLDVINIRSFITSTTMRIVNTLNL